MPTEVRLLGGFEVRLDGQPVAHREWAQRRAVDLVQLLALAPGRRLLRDQVIEALWPGLPAEAGAANLHKAAHFARRVLRVPDAVVVRSGSVALLLDADVTCDVERFEAAARRALAAGDASGCAVAADLYRGDLLPDRLYEEWTTDRREYLRGLRLDLLRRAGRWEDVLALDPADEAAHRALMRRQVERGNRHAALRQFQRLRTVLARDLGARPEPETVAVYREVVAGLSRASAASADVFVGRAVELARVRAVLRTLRSRGPTAVLVAGEAGIGKSRLCERLTREAAANGFGVLSATALASDEGPYGVVLRSADRLLTARPDISRALPEQVRDVLHASGRPGGQEAAECSRQQLIAALDRLCAAAGGNKGSVVFIDDAHLADDDSIDLIGTFARCATTPCVALLAFRSEEAPPALEDLRADLLTRAGATEVTVAPLDREESRELVERRAGARVAAETTEAVWDLARGNPFFTGELAAVVAESGTVRIPSSLAAATRARLSRLRPDLADTLRRVAVAADTVDADEFAALADLSEAAAFDALDEAVALGVLEAENGGYRFRHALVQRALADGLPPHRRAAVHRMTADRLAATGGPPGRVAHHLVEAGRRQEAVPWLERAARHDGAAGAFSAALAHVDLALAIEPRCADLLALRAELLFGKGDPTAATAYGAAGVAATGPARDALRVRQAWVLLANGNVAAAADALDGIVPDEATRLRFILTSGLVAWFAGRIADAERAAEETMRLATRAGDMTDLLDGALLHALVAHSRGRFAEQLRFDLLDPRLAGALAGILSDAHLCVAEIYLYGGRPAAVASFAAELRRISAEAGAARGEAFAATLLGEAELLAGELDAAREHLEDGVRLHRGHGGRGGEALALQRLAEVALVSGRAAVAESLLVEASEAARLSPLCARHLLTRIYGTRLRAASDHAAARILLDEAEACLVRPAEACPLCWVPYLVPAAITRARLGLPDAAEHMLTSADQLVGVLWRGRGGWAGALREARAEVALARGDRVNAGALFAGAAETFAAAGQPLDAARCHEAARLGGLEGKDQGRPAG